MTLPILSLIVALMIGLLLTGLFWPSPRRGAAGWLLRVFLGWGLGIGVTSLLYFLCLLAGLARYAAAADIALGLTLGLILFIRRRGEKEASNGTAAGGERAPLRSWIAGVLAVELVASLASFIVAVLKEPHGRWDAWLIWNMHARFLFRSGPGWREAFASGQDWSHWDYPLMLPLSIVRGWSYAGMEEGLFPAVMGLLFTVLVLGLLLAALVLLRGRTQGCLAAMVLMGTPFFIAMGASQFADVPLAFFILSCMVMLFIAARPEGSAAGPLVLAGMAAGLAAWTKNEGLLFALVAAGSLLGITAGTSGWRRALGRTAGFLAGALPVLAVVLYFKLRIAPANDLMAGFGWAALGDKLFDIHRYAQISKAFFVTGLSFTQGLFDVRTGMGLNPGPVNLLVVAAYLFLAGIRIERTDRTALIQGATVLMLMLAGYFLVYVLTPLDLTYHLMTSLNRLFIQLWPGILLTLFMIAGAPVDAPDDPLPVPGKGKPRRKAKGTK
jgi:hypothetical protein